MEITKNSKINLGKTLKIQIIYYIDQKGEGVS